MMKLSEAILLGSVGSEQGFGPLSGYKQSSKKCVIGAALLAVGDEATEQGANNWYYKMNITWPWLGQKPSKDVLSNLPSPISTHPANISLLNCLWLLNDTAKWTRPQIAAWVAELEAIYDTTTTESLDHERTPQDTSTCVEAPCTQP